MEECAFLCFSGALFPIDTSSSHHLLISVLLLFSRAPVKGHRFTKLRRSDKEVLLRLIPNTNGRGADICQRPLASSPRRKTTPTLKNNAAIHIPSREKRRAAVVLSVIRIHFSDKDSQQRISNWTASSLKAPLDASYMMSLLALGFVPTLLLPSTQDMSIIMRWL